MKLKKVATLEIIPTSPFNFDATFHKPDHFTSGDNYWEKGVRWQTLLWKNKTLGLKFRVSAFIINNKGGRVPLPACEAGVLTN